MKKLMASMLLTVSVGGASMVQAGSDLDRIIESGELKACFDAGYMPFEMKAKNNEFVGFDIDMGKQLAKSMGVKYTPVNTAWDGIIPALITGKCDIITAGMTITPQRNLKVNFADPYIVVGQSILISPKLQGQINSYSDLNDPKYTIATKLGTTAQIAVERLMPKAKVNLFETESEGPLEVINGSADAFVYDLPYNAIYSSQNTDKVAHLDQPFTFEPLGWAVRQGDSDYVNFLNNFLRQVKGDKTYDKLYAKWFKSDAWLKRVQ